MNTATHGSALLPTSADLVVPYHSPDGSSAWQITEPDAPGLFVLVYDAKTMAIPVDPETATMNFVTFKSGIERQLQTIEITGRLGLNAWYLQHVGFSPDKEESKPVPIIELIGDVGAHLLLRAFQGEEAAPDGSHGAG